MRHASEFRTGDIVAIHFGPRLSHYGLVTSKGTVISNSRAHGGVVEQSIAAFGDGKRIRLCNRTTPLDGLVAEMRARRAKGQRYRLLSHNCAHFSRWSRRQSPTALQVTTATLEALSDIFFNAVADPKPSP